MMTKDKFIEMTLERACLDLSYALHLIPAKASDQGFKNSMPVIDKKWILNQNHFDHEGNGYEIEICISPKKKISP